MYQDLKEKMDFAVKSDTGQTISGSIKLRADKWAGSLGTQYAFTRHWEGNLMGVYGKDFQNISLVIGYRW